MFTVQGAGSSCECFRPDKDCYGEVLARRADYFQLDIDDITDSVMQVMRICGLPSWVVEKTRPAIKQAMLHYDEIRYRVDRVPRKRFCKEDFMHDVARRGQMSRMDSQLAYSIVKRAFNAYYYGTALEGKRLKKLIKRMRHQQQCLWLHAAQRTAEVYAIYAGLMYTEQLQYEERIECIYHSLFEVLKERVQYDDGTHCICSHKPPIMLGSDKSSNSLEMYVPEMQSISDSMIMAPADTKGNAQKSRYLRELKHICKSHIPHASYDLLGESTHTSKFITKHGSKHVSKHSRMIGSKHSRMHASMHAIKHASMYSNMHTSMHVLKPVSMDDDSLDNSKPQNAHANYPSSKASANKQNNQSILEKLKSENEKIHCTCRPLHCLREFESERPQITAECSQGPYVCRWLPFKDDDDFKEHYVPCPPMEVICPPCAEEPCDKLCTCTCLLCQCEPMYHVGGEDEHDGEKLSAAGIEDQDTDFCFLAPFRDTPRVIAKEVDREDVDVTPIECDHSFKPHECNCVCEFKKRAYPHLFTWLAPFSDKSLAEPIHDIDDHSTQDEGESPKPPPHNITSATYYCWTRSTPAASDNSTDNEEANNSPQILLLATPHEDPSAPAVGMAINVSVKNQHQDGQVLKHQQIKLQKSTVPSPSGANRNSAERTSAAASAAAATTKKAIPPKIAAAKAPKTAAPTAPKPAATTNPAASAEDTLTKEDILNIIGLK